LPYRVDIARPPADAFDRLLELGALDIDSDIESSSGGLAAILPDAVTPENVTAALPGAGIVVSPAISRDDGSVWILRPRVVRVENVVIRLTDSSAFGTGCHPTTTLCIEALDEAIHFMHPDSILDVGTGSGILALAALTMGVKHAVGVDTDPDAVQVAAEHARMNNVADRFKLVLGGPETADGTWPLVVANILAAPLIEMAPVLVRRVASRGRLILSGIPQSLEGEVRQAYARLGMRHIRSMSREAWVVIVLQASW